MSSKELTKQLHKLVIRKFKKRKVQSSFIDNIWGADLADMQLISKFNKEIRFLLWLTDALVNIHGLFLWKLKKGTTITSAFQKTLDESNRKTNKIWVDKFCNRLQWILQ